MKLNVLRVDPAAILFLIMLGLGLGTPGEGSKPEATIEQGE